MSARQTILNQVMRFADPADMDVGNWDICTDNILSALAEKGYAIVPTEPTPLMLEAGSAALSDEDGIATAWSAMLTAAKETK